MKRKKRKKREVFPINLSGTLPDKFQKNVLLKNHTTYKIGGPAKYFFIAENKENLIEAVKAARELNLPIFILGGGSNILVSDEGFNGLAIKMQNSKIKTQNEKSKCKIIYSESGVKLADLVSFCAKNNLTGLEWAAGIPGTVGGAVCGNIQAFGSKISDSVEKTEALDVDVFKIKELSKEGCRFSLKSSIFKREKKLIIISVFLKLKKGDKTQIAEKITEHLNYRKKNHPINYPSAGSVFINPVRNKLPKATADWIAAQISNGVNPETKDGIIPAGYLMEQAGLKGEKIGDAQISEKHANFIINLGRAKAKDVLALINLAKSRVKKKFGINLETEVQFIGFKHL